MNSFEESVEKLAAIVSRTWSKVEQDLPACASAALLESKPWETFRIDEALRYISASGESESRFGEPGKTLAIGDGFYIEVLFWDSKTTTIHEHGFSGAWTVLSGSTLHVCYEFLTEAKILPSYALGELRVRHLEELHQGTITPITKGAEFIHRAFHLDSPTVSLVVRTPGESSDTPLDFRAPAIAIGDHTRRVADAGLDAIALLRRRRAAIYKKACLEFLESRDSYGALLLLAQELPHSNDPTHLRAQAADIHGSQVVRSLERVLEFSTRESIVTVGREQTSSRNARRLLGLLMTCASRDELLSAVRALATETIPPEEIVVEWARELSAQMDTGIDFDELNTILFTLGVSAGCLGEILDRFCGDSPTFEYRIDVPAPELKRHCRAIYSNPLFRPLFSELVAEPGDDC